MSQKALTQAAVYPTSVWICRSGQRGTVWCRSGQGGPGWVSVGWGGEVRDSEESGGAGQGGAAQPAEVALAYSRRC